MKRRCDSDGIDRAKQRGISSEFEDICSPEERRDEIFRVVNHLSGFVYVFYDETNCRKKVKFAGKDEEDDLSSEHPAFQGEETGAQNHKGSGMRLVFPRHLSMHCFKKLKEERHQKSLPHSLPEEDDHAKRLRSTNRLRGNEDSSVAVILNDVITAKLPTACFPASCVSEKPAKYLSGDLKYWKEEQAEMFARGCAADNAASIY